MRALPQPSSSVYLIKALLIFASEHGIDTDAMLREIGIDISLLDDEEARIPLGAFNSVWERTSNTLDDPLLGLHFGEAFAVHAEGHFLFTIMKNSETLRKAIESLIRYHNLITDIVRPMLSVEKGRAVILLENNISDAAVTGHISDAVLGLLATVLRRITGNEIRFEKIEIAHREKGPPAEYAGILGLMPVFAAARNRILFPESELNRIYPMAQKEFGRELREYAEKLEQRRYRSDTLIDRVLLLLGKYILKGGDSSLGATAGYFNMSVRSFQNLLKQEGATFQSLLDKAREKIAVHYLRENDVMLCDIAFLLGYSEQSSFNHAFKRWTGYTPREYREKNN